MSSDFTYRSVREATQFASIPFSFPLFSLFLSFLSLRVGIQSKVRLALFLFFHSRFSSSSPWVLFFSDHFSTPPSCSFPLALFHLNVSFLLALLRNCAGILPPSLSPLFQITDCKWLSLQSLPQPLRERTVSRRRASLLKTSSLQLLRRISILSPNCSMEMFHRRRGI